MAGVGKRAGYQPHMNARAGWRTTDWKAACTTRSAAWMNWLLCDSCSQASSMIRRLARGGCGAPWRRGARCRQWPPGRLRCVRPTPTGDERARMKLVGLGQSVLCGEAPPKHEPPVQRCGPRPGVHSTAVNNVVAASGVIDVEQVRLDRVVSAAPLGVDYPHRDRAGRCPRCRPGGH